MGRRVYGGDARSAGAPTGASRASSRPLARIAHGLMIAGTLVVALSGCASRSGSVPYNVQSFGPPDMETLQVPAAQQRIAPLDMLAVRVFQVEELSGQFRVDAEGRLTLPLIGAVQAAGKLPAELSTEIAQQLGQRYLRNPNVTVAIAEATQHQVTLEGAFREPGVVPLRGTTTLIRAIALGRGLSEDANPARIIVFRTVGGQRMAAAFDLRAIRRAEAPDPDIYGNDIIVVEGNSTRRFIRDIMTAIPAFGIFTPLLNTR
jgi:polysaccharide biosynthesis/export protein